jgi:hypothetical protein
MRSFSRARKVYLTDLNSTTLKNLNYNAVMNNLLMNNGGDESNENMSHNDDGGKKITNRVIVQKIDWSDESTWPKENTVDFILGSDLIYDKTVIHQLKHVILGLMRRRGGGGGTFLYTCKSTERDGMAEFLADILQEPNGITLVNQEEINPPHLYTSNPLHSGDDEECFLHFHELTTTSYMLYEFACY